MFPREHGTWAMLLVPWAIGALIHQGGAVAKLLVLGGALLFFLAHTHLVAWWRFHLAARAEPGGMRSERRFVLGFGIAGIVVTAPLIGTMHPAWFLLLATTAAALTAVSLWLVAMRLDHGLPGQALAAMGLPLTAPAAYGAGGDGDSRMVIAVWLLNATFFLWAVFYVRLKIAARAHREPRGSATGTLRLAGSTLVVDGVLLVTAIAALGIASIPLRAMLAVVPAAAQTVAGIVRLDRPATLKRVGIAMTLHAAAFTLLMIAFAR